MHNRFEFRILVALLVLAVAGLPLGSAASVAQAATVLAASVEEAVSTFVFPNSMHPMGFSARELTRPRWSYL
jgi:hypothetical protein